MIGETETAWFIMYSITATLGTVAIGMIIYGLWDVITRKNKKVSNG